MGGERDRSGARNYTVIQIIWLAFLISVVIYVMVAYIFINSTRYEVAQVPVRILFFALATVSLCLFIPQVLLRASLTDSRLFPGILEKVRGNLPGEASMQDPGTQLLLQSHLTFDIIMWALGEAPAIFGLTLTFLTGDIRFVAGFALYSILNMFIFRPSRSNFDDQSGRLRRYLTTRGFQL